MLKEIKKILAVCLILAVVFELCVPTVCKAAETAAPLNDEQKNAIAMYNYLVSLTTEIRDGIQAKENLGTIKTDLQDNLELKYIDDETKDVINGLVEAIDGINQDQFERNELILANDQSRAKAIKQGLMTVGKTAVSAGGSFITKNYGGVVNAIVQGGTDIFAIALGQETASEKALNSQLEASEKDAFESCINQLFNYKKSLADKLSLNDDWLLDRAAIDEFEENIANDNLEQRLLYLKDHENKYSMYGGYWLSLAECKFLNEDYQGCLDALKKYEDLGIKIFGQDRQLAEALPYGIASARQALAGQQYVETVKYYCTLLEKYSNDDDWYSRYVIANGYTALVGETNDRSYLTKAYEITKSNVNHLIGVQRELNDAYINPLDKKASKEEKQERKTALPPIYEPLILNLQLLNELANETDISDEEHDSLQRMLHGSDENYIMNEMLNRYLSFNTDVSQGSLVDVPLEFNGDEIIIPVEYTTDGAEIIVETSGNKEPFTDWELDKVERGKETNVSEFKAVYKSKTADKYKWQPDEKITISVTPLKEDIDEAYVFSFTTKGVKNSLVDKAKVWKKGIVFERG